ncbi:MAG: FtsW/RodA/SpoVE family cell cycle protein, partial [Candidatus Omnitrophota bacterium]
MVRNIRINLFITTVILVCIGVVMIYSASSIYALERYKDGFFFLKRHVSFLVIGIFLTLLIMSIDYRKIRKFSRPLLFVSLLLLVLVLIPGIGREVAGARRWFRFRFISFQPSGLAHMAVIIYAADFIARKGDIIRSFRHGFLPPMVVLGITSILILAQPDLGSTLALGAVMVTMFFIAGVRLKYLLSLLLSSLPLLYILIFSVPYRRMRIMAFLNPWLDPKG